MLRRIPNTFVMSHEYGLGDTPVNSRAETIGSRGNKCMIFRRKAGASINETAVSRDSRSSRGGWGMDGRGPLLWRPDSMSIGTYVISFRPRFRKSLIFERAFLRTSRSPKPSREIVSRRFDGIELPKIYCSRCTCGNLGQGPGRELAKVEARNTFPAAPI